MTRNAAMLAMAFSCLLSVEGVEAQNEDPGRRTLRPLVNVHAGWASIEKADNTVELGVLVDIGSYRTPRLRIGLGIDYLNTEPDRGPTQGSFSDLSLNADLRYKPFRLLKVVPYVGAGVGLHIRSNDIADSNIADIYDGVVAGVQGLVGLLVDGSETGRWGISAELRATRAQNLHRTSARAGIFLRL